MLVKKTLKQIDKYRVKYDYKYGSGYFIFTFGADEFNLHITFKQLPMMKFGIWKVNDFGSTNYYFAACSPYIDKFKPSCSTFDWDSLESMMEWVAKCINDSKFYISELERVYDESFMTILKDYADDLYRDSHNGFDPDEYSTNLQAFNKLVSTLDVEKFDMLWRRSDGFKNLYDVFYYPEESVTDEEIDELENKLWNCRCFSFQWRTLPPHFFKKRWLYRYKIHPGNHSLYFNQKKHLKYFNHPDKQ